MFLSMGVYLVHAHFLAITNNTATKMSILQDLVVCTFNPSTKKMETFLEFKASLNWAYKASSRSVRAIQ